MTASTQILEAFHRVQTYNSASLVDLRAALPWVGREEFDAALERLRRAGKLTLSGAEGRNRLTLDELEAAVREEGDVLLFAHAR